jgi:LysR family transcriptional regulator, glycine cleavage system transcriptional activator
LGVKLFERCVGGVRLTDAGRRHLREVEPAYLEFLRATTSIGPEAGQGGEVKLSLSHSLAVGWLIPRLNRFRAAHPDIELSFKTQRGASDLRRGDVDVAICFSDIDLSGLDFQPLLDVFCTPVASPAVARTYRENRRSLARHRLLAVSSPPDVWPWWAQSTGCELGCESSFIRFDMLHAMYESASQDIGIAMGSIVTVLPHLESGRLQTLGLPVAQHVGGYRLATNANSRLERPVASTLRWLKAEAVRTPRMFESSASVA